MKAAMRANLLAGVQLALENHLLAVRALMPEVIRHLRAAKQGPDFRANKFTKPAHGPELPLIGR
jgi:hypothetical protein